MAGPPHTDSPDVQRVGTTKSMADFTAALGKHLPRRLSQLRELGKATRELGGRRPKR